MLGGVSSEGRGLGGHALQPPPPAVSRLSEAQVLVLDGVGDTGRGLVAVLADAVFLELEGGAAEDLPAEVAAVRADWLEAALTLVLTYA